jgi:hypothetical protein
VRSFSVRADTVELKPEDYWVGWDVERKGFHVNLGNKTIAVVSASESKQLLEEIALHTSKLEPKP